MARQSPQKHPGPRAAGETDFIEWIRRQGGTAGVRTPPGDDMAALDWAGGDILLVGADQVAEGVHFDLAVHTARQVGRKVMNRNLSDCGAMGCLPAGAVCTVMLPRGKGLSFAKDIYRGLRDAADKFSCPIIGGDTGSWRGPLVVSVTILGRSAGVTPVSRGGAKPGDAIYVTGALGGSIVGRHMTFRPRVEWGRQLAQAGASAMIDISDGLSRDLLHICTESKCGAELVAADIAIHRDARKLAKAPGPTALEHALHDGEDYELLATGPADLRARAQGVKLIRIGTITQAKGMWLCSNGQRQPLAARGWEHGLDRRRS